LDDYISRQQLRTYICKVQVPHFKIKPKFIQPTNGVVSKNGHRACLRKRRAGLSTLAYRFFKDFYIAILLVQRNFHCKRNNYQNFILPGYPKSARDRSLKQVCNDDNVIWDRLDWRVTGIDCIVFTNTDQINTSWKWQLSMKV
jgi:hypothetical protein